MLKILRNALAICFLSTVVIASEPYCLRNESIIIRTPVTKTRQIIKRPTGFFKAFKKTKVFNEQYEDFEERVQTRSVRSCCDGYMMSRFNICEPICESGCPMNAQCVEPNLCKCKSGYISAVSSKNGSHYCEPICNGGCPINARCAEPDVCECERGYHTVDHRCEPRCTLGCPFGGVCIQPEKCRCEEGYAAERGTCIPICSADDRCPNGRCVDKEKCDCNKDLETNFEIEVCEKVCVDLLCNETFVNESEYDTTTMSFETFDEEYTTEDSTELDESEKIFLTPPSDYTDDEDYTDKPDSTVRSSKCPPNYTFYENMCRPKVFASNEVDCKFKPCIEHAICQANGTCACIEGYSWYRNTESSTPAEQPAVLCLTFEDINERLKESRISEVDHEDTIDWISGSCIILGVLCMAGAICFLTIKFLKHKNGKMDVEVKNDLYCTYENKNSRDIPHVP